MSQQVVRLITPERAVIRLHPADNVGVARVPLSPGQRVRVDERLVEVQEPIPVGHKLALEDIPAGKNVVRYGTAIGKATVPIRQGTHVHTHNVTLSNAPGVYEFPEHELPLPEPTPEAPTFLGYRRSDGRVGTRNYIAVVAASNCAAYVAELVARSFEHEPLPANVDGVRAFPHGHGCSIQIGPDTDQLYRTISGILDHPNVAGAVIIGLGCEVNHVGLYLDEKRLATGRLVGFTLQEVGGTRQAVRRARALVEQLIDRAAEDRRVPVPASEIVLGLQCGGSDAFSGITANPALGNCCDRLVRLGGTVVLAETTETFGAENLLVRRARNRQVAERYLALVEQYKAYLRPYASTFNDNPSPGNREGGLTNILEKSLGAVAKAGTSPLMDAIDYAERIRVRGLVFMNTPGNDPISLTGLAAGGVNVIAFTTGRGSTNGFPIVPVIKISSNTATYERMREDMDVNAGRIADGEATVEQVGGEIFQLVLRVASGERTASERLGHNEFVPWRIGPVL